jgi:hypothetical protein
VDSQVSYALILFDHLVPHVYKIWALSPFPCGPDWARCPDDAEVLLDQWRVEMMHSSMPVVEALRNDPMAFSGVGRHLANNICFENAFYPSMPVSLICHDDKVFASFKANLRTYMHQWIEPEYFETCGGNPVTNNPFEYNEKSGRKYAQERLRVFRKAVVSVPDALFNWYVCKGLLDPDHTIGLFFFLSLPQVVGFKLFVCRPALPA